MSGKQKREKTETRWTLKCFSCNEVFIKHQGFIYIDDIELCLDCLQRIDYKFCACGRATFIQNQLCLRCDEKMAYEINKKFITEVPCFYKDIVKIIKSYICERRTTFWQQVKY